MIRPAMVIGIGTSGTKVIESLRKIMYEHLGQNSLPVFHYIAIETNSETIIEPTPVEDNKENELKRPIQVDCRYPEKVLTRLRNQGIKLDWVDEQVIDAADQLNDGAGGHRAIGRLGLWDPDKFSSIYGAIDRGLQRIREPKALTDARETKFRGEEVLGEEVAPAGQPPAVYVVGTLAGGTNSGMLIDIGYMVQKLLGFQTKALVYGVFMLLPADSSALQKAYGNIYRALVELKHFSEIPTDPDYRFSEAHRYREDWPNNLPVHDQLSKPKPYKIVFLVSQEYGDPGLGKIRSKEGLYRTVALQLFTVLVSGFPEKIRTDIDAPGRFATFGISAVTYPRYAIGEYVACRIAIDLCERWTDQNQCLDGSGGKKPLKSDVVRQAAKDRLQQILNGAVGKLRDTGQPSDTLESKIKKQIADLRQDGNADSGAGLQVMFKRGSGGDYYSMMLTNCSEARKELINSIYNEVWKQVSETENLKAGEYYLDGIQEGIDEILQYWQKILEPATSWEDTVEDDVNSIVAGPGLSARLVRSARAVREDRLMNLTRKLEIHLMSDILREVRDGIRDGGLRSYDGKALPTQKEFRDYQTRITTSVKRELTDRRDTIVAEVTDTTTPIYRVWSEGGLEQDAKAVLDKFIAQWSENPSLEKLLQWDIRETLNRKDLASDLHRSLHKDIIQSRGLVPDIDTPRKAKERWDEINGYIQRSLATLLRLKLPGSTASRDQGVPRVVVGRDQNALADLVDAVGSRLNITDKNFTPEAAKSMQDTVVFYEEMTDIAAPDNLEDVEHLRRAYLEPVKDPLGNYKVSESNWQGLRRAFNIEGRIREIEAKDRIPEIAKLFQFISDVMVKWLQMPTGQWRPEGRTRFKDLIGLRFDESSDIPELRTQADSEDEFVRLDPNEDSESVKSLARNQHAYDSLVSGLVSALQEADRDRLEREAADYLDRRFGLREGRDRMNRHRATLKYLLDTPMRHNSAHGV